MIVLLFMLRQLIWISCVTKSEWPLNIIHIWTYRIPCHFLRFSACPSMSLSQVLQHVHPCSLLFSVTIVVANCFFLINHNYECAQHVVPSNVLSNPTCIPNMYVIYSPLSNVCLWVCVYECMFMSMYVIFFFCVWEHPHSAKKLIINYVILHLDFWLWCSYRYYFWKNSSPLHVLL